MKNRIGNMFVISGMAIKIMDDDGEKWKALNITTRETVYINKLFLEKAIKLGKAEAISETEAKK